MAKRLSRPALRISFSKLPAFTTTAMWMGSCLLGGFALGSRVHHPLKTTTLNFDKVAWVANQNPVQLAKVDEVELKQNELKIAVNFTPFELPARKQYRLLLSKKTHRRKLNSWARLDQAIKNLKLTYLAQAQRRLDDEQENLFIDYRSAIHELRRDFHYSMIPTIKSEEVRTVVSSAENDPAAEVIDVQYGETSKPVSKNVSAAQKLAIQQLSIHKNSNNPDLISNLGISERASAPIFLAMRTASVKREVAKRVAIKKGSENKTEKVKTAEQLDSEIQQLVQLDSLTGRDQTARIPDEPSEAKIAIPAMNQQEFTTYFNSTINKEDQKVLTEALLNEQMKTLNGVVAKSRPPEMPSKTILASNTNGTARHPSSPPSQKQPGKTGFGKFETSADEDDTAPEAYDTPAPPAPAPSAIPSSDCAQLGRTRFINTLGNQICPTSYYWISKNWAGSGWVKVESDHSPSLLTYYPSPNTGTALSMDKNSIALLGLTSGAKVMNGMGVITGLVPDGFDVEFAGRAEEPEYFVIQGKRYFAIINAEPGAGVVQLISKQNQEDSATVFAPVMEDTITYLDLAPPKNASFTVKVVKNGGADAEVVGLTVGISTGGKIQAITQSQGRAFLRDVPVVPGYPLYIDVSSKIKNQRGYMYRYLLKNRNRSGDYVVYQVAENSLGSWIRQVRQGLSDQSAMVVGFFNRKRLGGFKEHFFAKAIPQTARFGLDPLNYSVLWDGQISANDPLEGDLPRFMSVQVPEGLTQLRVSKESGEVAISELIPISPRVIHVVSE